MTRTMELTKLKITYDAAVDNNDAKLADRIQNSIDMLKEQCDEDDSGDKMDAAYLRAHPEK